jgi:hypothetical protein
MTQQKSKKELKMATEKKTNEQTGMSAVERLLAKAQAVYEPVLIPSRGIVYPEGWTDTHGRMRVRRWTVEEEKILSTARLVRSGKAIDMMLSNCLENQEINTGELLSGDRSFLLYHLRNVSYGSYYEFKLTCQRCGAEYGADADLNNIKVVQLPADFKEPIVTTLPISKVDVTYRLMRGKDEFALLHARSNSSETSIDNTLVLRYARQVLSLDGIEDKAVIESFINKMPAGDSAHLREHMDKTTCGVDFTMKTTCSSCGAEQESEMPLTANFFRTTGNTNA